MNPIPTQNYLPWTLLLSPHSMMSLVALVALVILVASFSSSAAALNAGGISTSQRFKQFVAALYRAKSDEIISLQKLHTYPEKLLTVDSQYPLLKQYSWADIETLLKVKNTCRWVKADKPTLQTAVDFEWMLCKKQMLSESWWTQAPLLHPAGGSYADRYLEAIEEHYGRNSDETTYFLTHHANLLTLSNPLHPLHNIFKSLEPEGVAALLAGSHFFLASDNSLWLDDQKSILKIAASIWQPLAKENDLVITQRLEEQSCAISSGNLCVTERDITFFIWWIAGILFCLVAALGIARVLRQRQQDNKEKKFILQLLIHELRTPVASLNMTIEQFRADYDQLSERGQIAFGRLLKDCSRLHRLTETSKGFLSSDNQSMLPCQSVLLSEWLTDLVNNYPVHFTINKDKELSLPWYWLGLCLENLIRNALAHGKPPVFLVISTSPRLRLEVTDQGVSPGWWQLLIRKKSKNRGMGIGLILVKRIMRRLGGRLIHYRHPTRYILELDYDKTAAS